MFQRILVFAIFSIILFTACESYENSVAPTNISSGLDEYVKRFELEAASRGYFLDVDALGVHLSFKDIPENNVLGVCYYHSNRPNKIEIDQPSWNRLSDSGREYVVFH